MEFYILKMTRLFTFFTAVALIVTGGLTCLSVEGELEGIWQKQYSESTNTSSELRFYSALDKGEEFTYFNNEENSLNCQLKFDFSVADKGSGVYVLSRTFSEGNFCIDFYTREPEEQPYNYTETTEFTLEDGVLKLSGSEFRRADD